MFNPEQITMIKIRAKGDGKVSYQDIWYSKSDTHLWIVSASSCSYGREATGININKALGREKRVLINDKTSNIAQECKFRRKVNEETLHIDGLR